MTSVLLSILFLSSMVFAATLPLLGSNGLPIVTIPGNLNFSTPSCIQSQYSCGFNTITTNGNSQVNVAPDIATVNVQIQASGINSQAAIDALSKRITNALNILTNLGLNSNNWIVTSLSIYPNTSYVNGTTITYGQIASQSMQINVPITNSNGSSVGKIYDGLAQVSGITINSLNFDLVDKTIPLSAARSLAYQDSVNKAKDYCSAASLTLGTPLTINDESYQAPVPTVQPQFRMMAASVAVPTTVSIGTIKISYSLNTVFSFA